MNEEAKHWLETTTSVVNEGDGRGGLKKKAVTILSAQQVDERKEELRYIEGTLAPGNVAARDLSAEGRQNYQRRKRALQDDLAYMAPPDQLDAETKDVLHAKEKELAEAIRQGMPTDAEMWRNGVGVTDKHMRWHASNKFLIAAWKNIRRVLNPHDNSLDLANVERLRPQAAMPGMAATYDVNAAMPGHFAMSAQAKANWPESMPEYGTVNSPMKQAEDREKEELKAKIEALEQELKVTTQRKANITKQRQENMRKAREKAMAKRAESQPPAVEA